jgi:glycosyltransferase involved in cell wall biosynthesis
MKVLLVSESINKFDSGGKVVRFLIKILEGVNIKVKVLILNERIESNLDDFISLHDIEYLPIKRNFYNRLINIFINNRENAHFKKVLLSFQPDIVHFASFENSKPSKFLLEAKNFGAKIILQPWTMHFYCVQGFGFRNNNSCTKCVKGNYFNALLYRCAGFKSIPLIIERYFLQRRALLAQSFLSSNSTLDEILEKYGVSQNKIFNFPVPFDCSNSTIVDKNVEASDNYYIYYGQVNDHKGLRVLQEVFHKLPNLKFKVLPMSNLPEKYFPTNNVEIINNIGWDNGLKDYIRNSKAVLIPSLWVTSTEYSMCEALLFKKPVVIFNTGVHKDIFVNGVNAMVAEINDINSFANAILEIDNNPDLLTKLSESGHDTLLKLNNSEKLSRDLLKVYLN